MSNYFKLFGILCIHSSFIMAFFNWHISIALSIVYGLIALQDINVFHKGGSK